MHIFPIKSLKKCGLVFSSHKAQPMLDLSCLFWKQIFKAEEVIDLLEFSANFDDEEDLTEHIKEFVNADSKKAAIEKIILTITGIGIDNKTYFETIEVINYLLLLYSQYYYNDIPFSIEEALDMDIHSSKVLLEFSQNEEFNPYMEFLKEHLDDNYDKDDTDVIFVNGRPGLFSFTQLYLIKKDNPQASVFLTNHSSEYFSLNKISDLLEINTTLFSIVDGIILDDFAYTQALVESAIDNEESLENIPNLLLKTAKGIIQTPYKKREKLMSEINIPDLKIDFDGDNRITNPHEIFETKLQINYKCHWGACSYCGINTKYPSMISNDSVGINEYAEFINEVERKNYKLLILQDEAISAQLANELALKKYQHNNNLPWHYRSKIETDYTDEVINNLAKSNLKGIYFGLESINERVLGLMNKYKEPISPLYIEALAQRLFDNNIHCHFCVIIGFPDETKEEVLETLDFIRKIKKRHNALTFTINIFEPDYASPLYTDAEKYNFKSKIPVAEDEYISNNIVIERSIAYEDLMTIKTDFLLENIKDSNTYITEIVENPNSLINYINKSN